MSGRTFVDTNVLVYAFDTGEPAKREIARHVIEQAAPGELVLSAQVLNEFYVTVTRKLQTSLPVVDARQAVERLAVLEVVDVTASLVLDGVRRSAVSGFSLWDSLIIEAACAAGCDVLLSEDLTHGQRFDHLVVEDPFIA